MMRRRRQWFAGVLIGAGIVSVGAALPVYRIESSPAVDLSAAVRVGSTAVPRDRFFLTDVRLVRASPIDLALVVLPGLTLGQTGLIVCTSLTARGFADVMHGDMTRSETIAALVAERMAHARRLPIRYDIGEVGGNSGGLMLALRIYAGLHSRASAPARSFAGTGTIALDGRIGPIEGTREKLIAAKRAGARFFFVPRANYADIADERDVRVIPVDTFRQAARVLDGRKRNDFTLRE